ncbi:helix-turn-helix transcriptional regulator [Paenibacillus sp. S33]|uniref:Helix-turn-helix transcriptional regulator n=1 Tax=Paenibacillus farraposensis TaxID=2807095 RepID=A0ABW4DHC6_9BACL|nr:MULTISPECIES: PadR family transcriptional regulator [Paenibacillus]KJD37498.1 PadR family transcriptional regulator [Paenibacillus polymyxa]MBE3650951.1 PadR family transcriptional regulator [Paenibacillus polymyxa]MBY7740187.1 PadR family transcriptional regulator [Paenibacillus polymyxa]MCC3380603.1 PadR family transcriptional regulator [Paenibacillus farraposensis]MCP3746768.1 PadR family transcriptional regulator [Paenibacillus sp. A3M_27_13]
MPRNEYPLSKQISLHNIVRVQQVIDFFVLSELQRGRLYGSELEQQIIVALGKQSPTNVGVNNGYLSARLKKLAEEGHVTRAWDGDNRYNRYYSITPRGHDYFKQLLKELPDQVDLAINTYTNFKHYIDRFGHIPLN